VGTALAQFLESLPFMATAALNCLHWTQPRELMRGAWTPDAWRLRWKRNHLPVGYLASVAGGIVAASPVRRRI
jgi:hypothetical protein